MAASVTSAMTIEWSPISTTSFTTPATSDSISFMIFIASMMHSTWPLATRVPTDTNGLAPGSGAA